MNIYYLTVSVGYKFGNSSGGSYSMSAGAADNSKLECG